MDKATVETQPRTVTDRVPVAVQLMLEVTETDVVEKDVQPGRLLMHTTRKRTLTRPVPEPFVVEADMVGRLTQSRTLSAVGIYVRGDSVFETDQQRLTAEFLTQMRGAPPGGRRLEPAQVLAWITEALAEERFTMQEVTAFAGAPTAIKVLRQGVLADIMSFVAALPDPAAFLAALEREGSVPGFTAALGVEGLGEYLVLRLRQLDVAALLSLPGQIKAVAP